MSDSDCWLLFMAIAAVLNMSLIQSLLQLLYLKSIFYMLTIWHSTLSSTILHSAILHSTIWHSTLDNDIVQDFAWYQQSAISCLHMEQSLFFRLQSLAWWKTFYIPIQLWELPVLSSQWVQYSKDWMQRSMDCLCASCKLLVVFLSAGVSPSMSKPFFSILRSWPFSL